MTCISTALNVVAHSKDESYSVISGKTITGKPFRFRAIWWTDDKKTLLVNCAPSVKRYLDKRTTKDQYSPYVISGGSRRGGPHRPALGRHVRREGADFGVPEANVFK